MTYILPILMSVAALFAGVPLALAQQPAATEIRDGNQLVAGAEQWLLAQPALEAKLRQRATLFGQRVTGAGYYMQLRDGPRLLLRYEFKLQLADQSSSLLQVNDGTTLWIRRDKGALQSQSYVNLRRIRDARRGSAASSPVAARVEPDLAFGGLGAVLHSLTEHFTFDTPRATEWKDVPMWEVAGTWRADRWPALLPDQAAAIAGGAAPDTSRLAEHLPDTVQLTLGRDENFPLFPYRLEYGRKRGRPQAPGSPAASSVIIEPLLTLELFEVRRRPDLTPADFAFKPGNEGVEDLTDTYLEKLSPPP